MEDLVKPLRDLVCNRQVSILLPGPSLKHLVALPKGSILATVNHYWLMEKFGRVDIVLAAAEENQEDFARYESYVQDGGLFLTTRRFGLYGDRVVHFETDDPGVIRQIPDGDNPLSFRALPSFAILILMLTIAGVKHIDLYGADGGKKLDGELYWGAWPSASEGRLAMDTKIINQAFPIIMKRVCKLYQCEAPEIINHSLDSWYDCFKQESCGWNL